LTRTKNREKQIARGDNLIKCVKYGQPKKLSGRKRGVKRGGRNKQDLNNSPARVKGLGEWQKKQLKNRGTGGEAKINIGENRLGALQCALE